VALRIAIPVAVFFVTFGAGVLAATRLLERLKGDRIDRFAFGTTCALLGAAAGVTGLEIYTTALRIHHGTFKALDGGNPGLIATGLEGILINAGTLLGFAAVVYVLASNRKGVSAVGPR
jgi:hypothetical protein